jgi:hypothetical protein
MIIRNEPEERISGDVSAVARPEKGFLMLTPRRDAPPCEDAFRQARTGADRDAVPQGRPENHASGLGRDPSEDARLRLEAARRFPADNTRPVIEVPASLRERSAAIERFERRVEEIARAAEVAKRALMQDPADFLPPFVEERLPKMRDELCPSGRNEREQTRGQDADPRVEKGVWSVDAEGRDAIPFGLKRRVVLRVPVFRDEERRGAPRFAVTGQEPGEVGLDGGVRVDDEKVSVGEEGVRVAERAGGPEDRRLEEKRELRKIRRLMAQVALDLVAQVMEINRYFADAGLSKPPEVSGGEWNVQEGEKGLGDRFRHGPEAFAPAGAKENGSHLDRET